MINIPDSGPVVILHDTDQDGYGAATAAAHWAETHNTDYKLVPLSKGAYYNGIPFEDLPEEAGLYLVLDFSFEHEKLFTLAERGPVAVIDHHRTFAERVWPTHTPQIGVKEVKGPDGASFIAVYDENRSAAVLTWRALVDTAAREAGAPETEDVPDILHYIEDYDLWNWKYEKTDVVHEGLEAEGYEVEDLMQYINGSTVGLMKAGRVACSYRDKQITHHVKHANVQGVCWDADMGPVEAVIVKCSTSNLKSKLGHRVLEEYPDAHFAIVYTADLVEDKVYCSLRSRGDFDVRRVAESLGGGGHEAAAGCSLSIDKFRAMLTG